MDKMYCNYDMDEDEYNDNQDEYEDQDEDLEEEDYYEIVGEEEPKENDYCD